MRVDHADSDSLSDLVLGLGQADSRGRQFSKLRIFYQSCVDTDNIRTGGYQPAVRFIKQQFGAYLDPALGDRGDLTDVIHGMFLSEHLVAEVCILSPQ